MASSKLLPGFFSGDDSLKVAVHMRGSVPG